MTADLLVPFQSGSTFHQVHPLENCICSEFLPNCQHSSLKPAVTLLFFKILKDAQLDRPIVCRYLIGADSQAAEQQAVVGPCID